jgi:hypothetical protein
VSTTKTKRRPSKREQARRGRQKAEAHRRRSREGMGRTRQRQTFSAHAKSMLGTDDPEVARLTIAANPQLFERLLAEYELVPADQRVSRDAVYVHQGYDSDSFELCDSAVNVETWYKQDHRKDDIDNALVNGWCEMQNSAAEGLRQSRMDCHVRDMVDSATGGGLTKTSEHWLDDLCDYLGVYQNVASDLRVLYGVVQL